MKTNCSIELGYFKFVEVMIVVAIVGLLAAITIPNFIRAKKMSQKNACIHNLQELGRVKQSWILQKSTNSAFSFIIAESAHKKPICSAGGIYWLNRVGVVPSCSFPGHVFQGDASLEGNKFKTVWTNVVTGEHGESAWAPMTNTIP